MKTRYTINASCFDRKGRLISTGQNNYNKSNPLQKKYSIMAGMSEQRIFIHAEVASLIKSKDKNVYSMKIERYDSKGMPKLAWPCPSCQLIIKEYGVKLVVFTTEDGDREWIVQ